VSCSYKEENLGETFFEAIAKDLKSCAEITLQ